MRCPRCGTANQAGTDECRGCGSPLQSDLAPGATGTSGKAIWSLILAILGVTCFWVFTGIPAILLGLSAKKDILRSSGRLSGNALATSGIVIGVFSFILSCPVAIGIQGYMVASSPEFKEGFMKPFDEAQTRAKVSRGKSDIRMLAVALESYYIDNNRYPRTLYQLTTPVMYITSIPEDPHAGTGFQTILDYHTDYRGKWILRSLGPDRDADADLQYLVGQAQDADAARARYQMFEYDPTNGTASSGDILRAGP